MNTLFIIGVNVITWASFTYLNDFFHAESYYVEKNEQFIVVETRYKERRGVQICQYCLRVDTQENQENSLKIKWNITLMQLLSRAASSNEYRFFAYTLIL